MNRVFKTLVGLCVVAAQLAFAGGGASTQSNGPLPNQPKKMSKTEAVHAANSAGFRVRHIEPVHPELNKPSTPPSRNSWDGEAQAQEVALKVEYSKKMAAQQRAQEQRRKSKSPEMRDAERKKLADADEELSQEEIDQLRAKHNQALTMTTKALARKLGSRSNAHKKDDRGHLGWIEEQTEKQAAHQEQERIGNLNKQKARALKAIERLGKQ